MRIPKKIKIGCREYRIKTEKKQLELRGNHGEINYNAQTIVVQAAKDETYSEASVIETLAHEFAHGYFLQFCDDLNTEKNANMFADMVLTFAKEMGWYRGK